MLVLHMALAIIGLLFICAHLFRYLATRRIKFFRSMVDGYHRHRPRRAGISPPSERIHVLMRRIKKMCLVSHFRNLSALV